MAYYVQELNEWAINKIITECPNDIDILVGHAQWNVPEDGNEIRFNYFIPCNEKGFTIAKEFIIENIGYDFWAMPWERLEHIATLAEPLTTILVDGVILWARNEEAIKQFEKLQEAAKDSLKNDEYRYNVGLKKIDEAMNLYKVMMFDDNLSHARKAGSCIADILSQAIACINGTYFKRGPENQDVILDTLEKVPEVYTNLYRSIVYGKTVEEYRSIAHRMIYVVREMFAKLKPTLIVNNKEINYHDLAAWYEEGTYWFRRLYSYTNSRDSAKTLHWGYCLQAELDYATDEYGLKKMDLLGLFDPDNLMVINKQGHEIEDYIVRVIEEHNIRINRFDSLEDFLKSGE